MGVPTLTDEDYPLNAIWGFTQERGIVAPTIRFHIPGIADQHLLNMILFLKALAYRGFGHYNEKYETLSIAPRHD